MTQVLVGAVGFVIGLVAHDLAIQSLDETLRLRPLIGTCRVCGHARGWVHSRCQRCGTRLSRELIVALASAGSAVGMFEVVGAGFAIFAYLAFLLLTMALLVTDIESFRIVDRLNLRGTVLVAALLAVTAVADGRVDALIRGLGGGLAYFAGSSLVFLAVRGRGFGAGDVKLSFQLGLFSAYLSWGVLGWAVFGTAIIGGVVALFMVIVGSAGMKTELPYGPPMILGVWTAIVMVGVGAIPIPS